MEMLEKAVKSLQNGPTLDLDQPLQKGTEVSLSVSAIIPEEYLPDVHMRLMMYKSIANCQSDDDIRQLKVEMIDRFGLLPEQIMNLFEVTSIKLRAEKMGIEKVDIGKESGKIYFSDNTDINPINIVQLVQSAPQTFKLEGSSILKIKQSTENLEQRSQLIDDVFQCLLA